MHLQSTRSSVLLQHTMTSFDACSVDVVFESCSVLRVIPTIICRTCFMFVDVHWWVQWLLVSIVHTHSRCDVRLCMKCSSTIAVPSLCTLKTTLAYLYSHRAVLTTLSLHQSGVLFPHRELLYNHTSYKQSTIPMRNNTAINHTNPAVIQYGIVHYIWYFVSHILCVCNLVMTQGLSPITFEVLCCDCDCATHMCRTNVQHCVLEGRQDNQCCLVIETISLSS